jgi:uncharacterized protein
MAVLKCAICGKPETEAYKPFCSKRCADVDLSRWLKGGYAIPGAPADEDEDGSSAIQGQNRQDSGEFED